MTEFYTYLLIDPRNNQPFYVGKGTKDRPNIHMQTVKTGKGQINKLKCSKIKRIQSLGLDVIVQMTEQPDEITAFNKEKELIKYYGKLCDNTGILTNITDGGIGGIARHSPIDRYDLFGNYIDTFFSISEAARVVNGSYKVINMCCSNYKNELRAYGYMWTYHNVPLNMQIIKNNYVQPIYEYNLSDKLTGKFIDIKSAAKDLSIRTSKNWRACNSMIRYSLYKDKPIYNTYYYKYVFK